MSIKGMDKLKNAVFYVNVTNSICSTEGGTLPLKRIFNHSNAFKHNNFQK